jgi:hypothetical protein
MIVNQVSRHVLLQVFLTEFADDRGLQMEFYEITGPLRDEDFLPEKTAASTELKITSENSLDDFFSSMDSNITLPTSSTASGRSQSNQRQTNLRSHSSMGLLSSSSSAVLPTHASSSFTRFSSDDTYGSTMGECIVSFDHSRFAEFFTRPSPSNPAPLPTTTYPPDSIYDLLPDGAEKPRPDSYSQTLTRHIFTRHGTFSPL